MVSVPLPMVLIRLPLPRVIISLPLPRVSILPQNNTRLLPMVAVPHHGLYEVIKVVTVNQMLFTIYEYYPYLSSIEVVFSVSVHIIWENTFWMFPE